MLTLRAFSRVKSLSVYKQVLWMQGLDGATLFR